MTDHSISVKVNRLVVQVRVCKGIGSTLGEFCCSDLPLSHSTMKVSSSVHASSKDFLGAPIGGKTPRHCSRNMSCDPDCGLDSGNSCSRTYIPDAKMTVEG